MKVILKFVTLSMIRTFIIFERLDCLEKGV